MLKLIDGRNELWQWDIGRKASVSVPCNEVHFANLDFGDSYAVKVDEGIVEIPNQVLQSGANVFCFAFYIDENGAYTEKRQTLEVNRRPKPSDYVYTQTEVVTIETAVNDALEKAKESGDFKGDKPIKGEDYFTQKDIDDMVNAVIAALPDGDGVAY